VKTTDAAGGTAYTEYNAKGLPWRTWGTAVQPTEISYDAYGRRTGLTTWQTGSFTGSTWPASPGAGNVTTWNLDPATWAVSSKVYPNSSSVVFTYNARGQVKARTWARGATTTYTYYDTAGSLTGELKKIDYDDTTPDVTFTYTRFGSLASVTDAAGTRTLGYDAILNPTSEGFDSSFYGSKTLTATYDSYTRPTGYSFNGSATVSAAYDYDSHERLHSVTGALGGPNVAFTFGYTAGTGWVASTTSGSYSRATPLALYYDVLASATTSWSGVGTLGSFTADNGDARGWRAGENSGSSGGTVAGSWSKLLGLGDGLQQSYMYTSYGQLSATPTPTWQNVAGTEALADRNWGWTYDLAGNRTAQTGADSTTYAATGSNVPNNAYGSLDEYVTISGDSGESTLKYDADGNLLQRGSTLYTYDGENRLHSVATGGVTTTFVYDYMGRRISKTVGGTTTKFLWWGWKLAAELADDGSTVNRTYVWGPDFSDARGAAGGAGSLLGQIDSDGTISYAMPDARGNIVGYINTSGVIVAATEYNAYGAVVHSYGTVADHPFGFAGQYTDAESELVYYGSRYYMPKHGRFINRDPIEEAGGNNLFAFVGNGPTNGWDVLGLTTICYDEGVLGTICVTNDGHIPNGATLIGGGTVRLDGNGNLSGTTYTVDYSGNGATYQLYSHQDGRSDNFATIAAPSPNGVADYGRQAGEDYRNQMATNSIAGAYNSPTSRAVDPTQPADVLTRVNGAMTSTGGTGGSIDRTWTVANPSQGGYIMQHVVRNGVEYWEVWPVTVANGFVSYSASQNDTVTFSDVSRTMVTASQKVQLEAAWLPGYRLDPKDNWQPGGLYGSADLLSVGHAPVGWPPSGPMIQDSGSMRMTVTHQPFVPDQTQPRTVTLQFTGQPPVIVQLPPRG
jgi:RHS repeat-associated protein